MQLAPEAVAFHVTIGKTILLFHSFKIPYSHCVDNEWVMMVQRWSVWAFGSSHCHVICVQDSIMKDGMANNSTASISQARKAVEQLKMEACMDRIKVFIYTKLTSFKHVFVLLRMIERLAL